MARAGWFGVRASYSNKGSGIALVLTGLGLAAYAMPSGVDPEARSSVRQAEIAQVVEVRAVRPAPAIPAPATYHAASRAADPAAAPQVATASAALPAASRTAADGEAHAAPAPRPREPRAIPADSHGLTLELQKELRRVGCYDGSANGVWTRASRRAMKAFTDQVNATLPIDRPDAVLLIMVQNQTDPVCGVPCPRGQGTDADGRCQPKAILANAAKKESPEGAERSGKMPEAAAGKGALADARWAATVAPTRSAVRARTPAAATSVRSTPPPVEGRMALAGPAPPDEMANPAPPARKAAKRARGSHHARSSRRHNRYVAAPRRGYPRPFFLGWLF